MTSRTGLVFCLAALMLIVFACSGSSEPEPRPSETERPPYAIVVGTDENVSGTPPGPVSVDEEPTVAAPTGKPSLAERLSAVDDQLANAPAGNLAYNRPTTMQMEQTIELQLLLSPVMVKEELRKAITEPGPVMSATINITPRMKAELYGPDPGAFTITPRHASPEQLLSMIEPTEWKWMVTANEEGTHELNLTVYRLVEFEGKEYWRVLREYEDVIQIEVTLGQRLAKFDWYWLVGIIITGLALPAFFLWLQRKRKT